LKLSGIDRYTIPVIEKSLNKQKTINSGKPVTGLIFEEFIFTNHKQT